MNWRGLYLIDFDLSFYLSFFHSHFFEFNSPLVIFSHSVNPVNYFSNFRIHYKCSFFTACFYQFMLFSLNLNLKKSYLWFILFCKFLWFIYSLNNFWLWPFLFVRQTIYLLYNWRTCAKSIIISIECCCRCTYKQISLIICLI